MLQNRQIIYVPSPHWRERPEKIRYIIIHCSAPCPEEQIKILNNLGLSTHYIIGQNGKIYELVSPKKTAYHAGLSHWLNHPGKSLNDCSIGIELESPSLGQNPADYNKKLMSALRWLLRKLTTTYHLRPENILGHSDIAPTRKPDPGVAFPWQNLYRNNLSVWYKHRLTTLKDEASEQKLLEQIGYDTNCLAAARYAFCRRFIPQEIPLNNDIKNLLDNPFDTGFYPSNAAFYLDVLKQVAAAFAAARASKG